MFENYNACTIQSIPDIYAELDAKYAKFDEKLVYEVADDLENVEKSYTLQKLFINKSFNFKTVYAPNLENARLQALKQCVLTLKSVNEKQHDTVSKAMSKLLTYDIFCWREKLVDENPVPMTEILCYTANTEEITALFLNLLVKTTKLSELINKFVPQYSLVYKHVLKAFDFNLIKLQSVLSQSIEKLSTKLNESDVTIGNVVNMIQQIFSENKIMVSFYENWKNSYADFLSKPLEMKSFFEYSQTLEKEDQLTVNGGIALGGLAFIYDVYDMFSQKETGLINLMSKLLVFQAYFAKIRVVLATASLNEVGDFSSEILSDYPIWLDSSCFNLVYLISSQKKISKDEAQLVKNFGIALVEFLNLGCEFINIVPTNHPDSIFGIEMSIFQARFNQLQDQLAAQPSSSVSVSTSLGEMLTNVSSNYLETANEVLLESQRWLIKPFEILIRHRILFQSKNENDLIRNKRLALDLVIAAQSYIEKAPLEALLDKNMNLLELSNLMVIAVKHSFCRRVFDHVSFVKNLEQILLNLEESSLDETINFSSTRKGSDIIVILHNFSAILLRCLRKIGGSDEDSQAASSRAQELHKFILNTGLFEKAFASKNYHNSEVKYAVLGFYLKIKLYTLSREQSTTPEQLENQDISPFLEFLKDFLSLPCEKFCIIQQVLEFTQPAFLQEHFLDKKGVLESMFLTSFTGKSAVAFQLCFGRIEKALFKYYVKKDKAKKTALLNIFMKCKKELIGQIEKIYSLLPDSLDQFKLLPIMKQLTFLHGVSSLIEVFAKGFHGEKHKSVKLANDKLDIQMLSCPLVLLYKHTDYGEMIHEFDLNAKYSSQINANYELLLKTFVKVQSEAGLLNLNEIETAKGKHLLNLIKHYGSHGNFKFPYFWGEFSLQSLKLAHYLEFIFIHSTARENPKCLFNIPQAKKAFVPFSEWTQSFNLTPAKFLITGVHIFLHLCENYIETLSIKEGKAENPQTIYKKTSNQLFRSLFYINGANFVWNSLNYIFLVNKNPDYTIWDDLSLVEEYQNIEPGDITEKKNLTKRVLRNHIISKILRNGLMLLSSIVTEGKKKKKRTKKIEYYGANQKLFVLSVIQSPKALERMFNWHIAASSRVDIFDEIDFDEKNNWQEVFNNIITRTPIRNLTDEEMKPLFDKAIVEKVLERCNRAFDSFIDNMPKIASKSLLLFSFVIDIAGTILDFYNSTTIGVKEDEEKLQEINLRKESLLWLFIQLRSTSYFFSPFHRFDSYTSSYAITPEKFADMQALLTCELVEDRTSNLCPNVTSCSDFFIEKEASVANLTRKLLCINFTAWTILLDKTKQGIDKKLNMLFMLSDYLAKNFSQISALSEHRKDQTDYSTKALIQHYVDLTSILPLLVGKILISFYLNAEVHSAKKKIWESIRIMSLLSYKFWKEQIKFEKVLINHHFPIGKIFGVLQFLQSSIGEYQPGGHILEDPEIKYFLTTPNNFYERNIELESLFLAQILSDYENRDILAEIELNNSISIKSWEEDNNFVKYFKQAIQTENYHEPTWIVDYCETMLDLEYMEDQRMIVVKEKKATAKEIWKLNYSIAKPSGIYEGLCLGIPLQVKAIIDSICDTMLSKVAQLSVAVDKSSSELSWCLMHLITIVDMQGYTTPYISSKKFKWTRPQVDDPQKLFLPIGENETELGFIDLLIKAAFIYQPYMVENFIQGLMKKGIKYNIEIGANAERPITLGVIFDIGLARSIDQALKITLVAFRQKPRLYLVLIINNYLKLLRILRTSFEPLLKSLSGAEKVEVCQVLQNIINTVSTIYCEMLLRTDNFSIDLFDFKFYENFLGVLYEGLFEHQLNGAVDWLATNFSFILVNLEKVQAFAKSTKHTEILDLEHFISRVSGGEAIPAKSTNDVKLRFFEGVSRQNSLRYYELDTCFAKEPKSTTAADEEICGQITKRQDQKGAMKFKTDCMEKFFFFYDACDTKSNYQNIKKYFDDLAVPETGEWFEKLSVETEGKLFARYDERKIAATALQQEEEAKQAAKGSIDDTKIQLQEPMSNVEQEETIVLVTSAVETVQSQLSSQALESQETKNEVPIINLANPVKMVHEDDSTEVLFLSDLDVLRKSCEKLPITQKQFIECLFTQENEFILSTGELTIERIVENRKAFLNGYILGLSPNQAKLFVQYLPAFLKEQLDPQLLNLKLFHPDHKQMLTDIIRDNKLLENANFEMFDLLNASLPVLRRMLEKETESQIVNSPLKKPQKEDDSHLTEEHKTKLVATANAFIENASQMQKAACTITWLYQADKELEIFLINALAKKVDKQVYDQILANPLNQLRFLASMLLILEDYSLSLLKKLAETHNKKVQVRYNELCENALSILLNDNTFFQRLSIRVPSKVLEAFVLPTLKMTESGAISEICPIGNSIRRLIAILSNEKAQMSAENKNRLITIIYNYFISESRFYTVNEISSPLHMQFKYNILSKELAEFILSSLAKIDDKRCSAVLIEIGKDINFLKLLKLHMMTALQKELKHVSQQVSEILPEITKIQDQKEFVEKIESITKLGNLKSLLRAAYLLTEPALQQFKGILGRKQFNDQNNQMNGKLFEWANLLEDLIQEVTNTAVGKEFIIAGFELIYLEYRIKNQKISTTSLQLFEVLVKFEAVRVLVEEIAIPLKGHIESEGISGFPWNSLQKVIISRDVTEAPQHLLVVATFSQMRRDCEVISIKEIYSFSLIKLKKQFINEMLDSIAPNDISKVLFYLKFSFLQNISQKEQSSRIRKPFSAEKIIEINRETHLQDSIAAYTFSFDDKSSYRPKIEYEGEIGYDAGGLFRAWLEQNTKILFDPGFGLFHRAENPRVIHPNPISRIIPDRLLYFEYAGYHVALAIRTNSPIDVHFTKSFYKMLLDRPLTLDDLEEIDSHLCAGLRWTLDNDAEDLMQTFSYQSDFLGKRYVVELVPEGSNIVVSNKNKQLYVKLLARSKMQKEVAAEIDAFLFGFNQLLSLSTIQNFSPSQLEAVIAGASKIDIQDMKTYAKISNSYSQEFLTWFWELLEEFDQNERSAFVYYISGSSNVSHGGFKDQPIRLSYLNDPERLPVAHTCFRILDLPQYPSKEILREKLVTAIFEGVGAFQIE